MRLAADQCDQQCERVQHEQVKHVKHHRHQSERAHRCADRAERTSTVVTLKDGQQECTDAQRHEQELQRRRVLLHVEKADDRVLDARMRREHEVAHRTVDRRLRGISIRICQAQHSEHREHCNTCDQEHSLARGGVLCEPRTDAIAERCDADPRYQREQHDEVSRPREGLPTHGACRRLQIQPAAPKSAARSGSSRL